MSNQSGSIKIPAFLMENNGIKVYTINGGGGSADVKAKGPITALKMLFESKGYVVGALAIEESDARDYDFIVHEKGGNTGNKYFKVRVNTKEPNGCDASVLHQRWFYSMKLVNEWPGVQLFFDKVTRCFYECGEDEAGGIYIKEYSPSHPKYGSLVQR